MRSDMERVRTVHVSGGGEKEAQSSKERSIASCIRRCGFATNYTLRRNEFWYGQERLSRDQYDATCRQQLLQVAQRKARPVFPPADRSRMGICLPRRDHYRV